MDMNVTAWENNLTIIFGSDEEFYHYYTWKIILEVLTVIVALVGLAGNTVVIWLLGFRIRRNTFSVYILNLAGADFLFLFCFIIYLLESIFSLDFIMEVTMRFLPLVGTFAYISSLSILSVISTERCMSVLWPIWYRCRRPTHMSTIMCALLCALSLLLSILKEYYCSIRHSSVHRVWCQVFNFIIVAWLIFLFLLLSGSSLALISRLLCGSQRVPPTRLYVTIMITVLVFLLCGLPFGFHWFLTIWLPNEYLTVFPVRMIVELLSCVNSCANPIIYFFVGSFRQ
ncbi:unnamed protein product [Pipistrellus nathusii]|uniref:G-protein coupled receptors family 1 profile domain-containing protein n=1 Tax=Pipistrellus nathusii TaxID=59473 RepID=A0ABP0AFI2_PIPNA